MGTVQLVTLILSSSALAAIVSVFGTVFVNKKVVAQQQEALAQQRLTETTRLMLDLMATAHGAPADGRKQIGVGQQLGAISMITTVGIENPLFRATAEEFLADFADVADQRSHAGEHWIAIAEATDAARQRLSMAR